MCNLCVVYVNVKNGIYEHVRAHSIVPRSERKKKTERSAGKKEEEQSKEGIFIILYELYIMRRMMMICFTYRRRKNFSKHRRWMKYNGNKSAGERQREKLIHPLTHKLNSSRDILITITVVWYLTRARALAVFHSK